MAEASLSRQLILQAQWGDAECWEAVHARRADLQLGNLAVEIARHEPPSEQLKAVHLRFHPAGRCYANPVFAYRSAAGAWFRPLFPLLLAKWRGHARHYGAESTTYRRILEHAIRDGLSSRLDRRHDDITALIQDRQAMT